MPSPDEVRAAMSNQILNQMANSADPTTRENAQIAINAKGGTAAFVPAPATAPAPVATAAPQLQQPPAPIITPAPQPAASPAAAAGADPLESAREANGLIFGKYRTPEEARRGYYNAANSLSQATDELVRLRNQPSTDIVGQPGAAPAGTMLPGSAPGGSPRVNPAMRRSDPMNHPEIAELVKSSEENGTLDPAQLAATIAAVSAREAQEAVRATVEPMQQMAEAESYMRATYPESMNHAQEIANFVKLNPMVGSTVQALMGNGQYAAAFEYAWNMYTVNTGISTERGMVANSQIAEEERVAARNAAGFSGSPNTGVHAPRPEDRPLTKADIEALNEHSKLDQGQLRRRALLGNMLPPEWRTWEQGR